MNSLAHVTLPPELPSFAEEIGRFYRARCKKEFGVEALERWSPQAGALRNLQTVLGRAFPALRTRHEMIDGHRLVYWDFGNPKGETVVLLHGFAASKENWLMLAPLLAQHRRLLVPDIPGFGQSCFKPGSDYRGDAQVKRLSQWLTNVSQGPIHLVGSSMGGALAGLLAANPELPVASLTLMNSAGVMGKNKSPFELALIEGRNHLVPATYSEVMDLFRLATHRNRQWLSWMLAPAVYQEMVAREPVNHRLFQDLIDSEQSFSAIAQVKNPTLILWGNRDRILDVSCTETLQNMIPHAQTRVLRGVGHLPMLEVPRLTAAALQRFWRHGPNRRSD